MGGDGPGGILLAEGMAEYTTLLLIEEMRGPGFRQAVSRDLELIYGEMNTFKTGLRHAGHSDDGKFGYKINARYYIMKLVNAALNRCFKLAPHYVNVNDWYDECPKPAREC